MISHYQALQIAKYIIYLSYVSSLAFMFCQIWNTYNFSSNKKMVLKLHIITNFDMIFLVIQFFR